MTSIGRAIRTLRLVRDLPAGEVAKRAKISNALLSLIEAGKRSPSVAVMARVANALRVDLDVLLLFASEADTSLNSSDEDVRKVAGQVDTLHRAEESLREALHSLRRR